MRIVIICSLLASVSVGPAVRPLRAQVDAERVRAAIDESVKYLKSQQREIGNWNDPPNVTPGGAATLCTLALLHSGVDPRTDKVVRRALGYLSSQRYDWTYTVALQTMVFCAADPKQYRLQILRNTRWLEGNQVDAGPQKGGWAYRGKGIQLSGGGDPSNSQFALLALHEAQRAGIDVKPRTWKLALDYWLQRQGENGAWRYSERSPRDTGSMTCAGIASVIIASGRSSAGDARVEGSTEVCCGKAEDDRASKSIAAGLRWLGNNFTVYRNPGSPSYPLYYLYGVERVGRLSAQRFIVNTIKNEPHDWYREGAEMLLDDRKVGRLQRYWRGTGRGENDPLIGTSLALLFLSKGRRPVLMAKLKHAPGDDWNHHRADAAHLTAYVEKKWKKDLTWQIIDPKGAGVDDLMETPVLYISGRDGFDLTDSQKKTLRRYVDAGGFLFAENCCGGKKFDEDFRQFIKDYFQSPMNLLPPDHPVWYAEEKIDPKYAKPLWGVQACCRTSIVYCPDNLSCYWQLAQQRPGEEYPAEVQNKVTAALSMGINVLAYATGRELKEKLDVPRLTEEGPDKKIDRGTLYVIKIRHSGGSDAAPNALSNLMHAARQNLKMRVSTERRMVSLTDDQLFRYHLAFMHGRGRFRFSDPEREALKKFIDRGGFLLVDSICANSEFTASFRREMKAIFPDQPLTRIPSNDPLLTDEFGGSDLQTVSRREPKIRRGDDPLKTSIRRVAPLLEAIKTGDRYAVVFSPYDLSCALESRESLECFGYVREDAARIGINALLYALHH